ncbi:unnamed protein product [Clonostachys chloroleuca]|uniref:Linalool dehydratase/isomerase domain-containing protein n=1 Tax=Clonostachys chloroleuca TaxID=1926264 RepID=A0AA35QC09_9HYPO|nr:unnamed protein product [Clonostachys chloroleuca]
MEMYILQGRVSNGTHDDDDSLAFAKVKNRVSNTHGARTLETSKYSNETVGDFGWGPWTIKDVLIPPNAGRGLIKKYHQRRTLYHYIALSVGGLWTFHNVQSTAYRAAALGLLFPGAGFTAVATIPSVLTFLVTLVLIPVFIFVWFAMGCIFFPLALWFGSSIAAGFMAGDKLFDQSAVTWAVFCYGGIMWLMSNARSLNAAGYPKAQERNRYLVKAVEEQTENGTPAPPPGSRELSLDTLRHVQHVIERGLSARDDFSYHDVDSLTGMAGLVISDRILGRDLGHKLRNRFEKSLEEEFTECDGRILPIRSEFTGLTLPGLCGTLPDCINAMLLTAYLPHLAHRNWAIIRKEFIKYDKSGQLQVLNLKGADKMDPGSYRAGEGPLRAFIAGAAAEFGDEKIRKEALDQLDHVYFPVETTKTGAQYNKGLSATSQHIALMARLVRNRDLANATLHGPSKEALEGPLLEEAPFPDVLVAKAYSHDGSNLDLVLYNGNEPGVLSSGLTGCSPTASTISALATSLLRTRLEGQLTKQRSTDARK